MYFEQARHLTAFVFVEGKTLESKMHESTPLQSSNLHRKQSVAASFDEVDSARVKARSHGLKIGLTPAEG